jgi:molybdate transport system ATP-binding protein
VYRDVPEPDRRLALRWLDAIGLADAATARFDRLSFGQQRLVLIARGLIKHPPLLILDEPTQGLDELGRQLVLAFVEQLATLERTTLLVVTHRRDEHLALFRRRLTFVPASEPGVRFRVEVT